jgi:hypothetical protein
MSGLRSSGASGPKAPKGPRDALDALLAGNSADSLRHALWLDALDQRLRPHLPPSLAAHARLANVNGAKLVFLVDSPVWHARLRLAAPELLEAARRVGLSVTDVVIKTISRPLEAPVANPRPVLPMSASARDALLAALASLADPDETTTARAEVAIPDPDGCQAPHPSPGEPNPSGPGSAEG